MGKKGSGPDEFGFGATKEEAAKEEKAAAMIQALYRGRDNRAKAFAKKGLMAGLAKRNKRWAVLQGRFSALQPEVEGVLRWAELSYLELPEDPQYNSRVILNNVSGRATPGKMLTVTGPHGSGQEELMMILAKQSLPGLSQGDVTLNAVSINSCPDFYRKIGFLLMEGGDLPIMGGLTPEEQVAFSARLRLNATDAFRKGRVEKALQFMGISGERQTTPIDQLSEVMKRRTALAVELVTYPPVLLVHDITEGLDSSESYHMMESLQKMSAHITVVVSVDANEIGDCYNVLDDLYMLAAGRLAYYGGKEKLGMFIKKMGQDLPPETNPGDFFIHLIDDSYEEHDEKLVDRMIATTYQVDLPRRMNARDHLVVPLMRDYAARPVDAEPLTIFEEITTLTARFAKDNFLNPSKYPSQIMMTLLLGVLIGTYFLHMDHDMLKSNAEQIARLCFTVVLMAITFTVRPLGFRILDEKPVIMRELRAGFYSPMSYYIIQNAVTLFECFFFVLLLVCIMMGIPGLIERSPEIGDSVTAFYPSGCNPTLDAYCVKKTYIKPGSGDAECRQSCEAIVQGAPGACDDIASKGITVVVCPEETYAGETVFRHILVIMFAAYCGSNLTFLLSYIFQKRQHAMMVATGLDFIFLVFCGFLVQQSNVPYMWYWLYYLSHHNYAYRALVDTEIGRRYTSIKTYTSIALPQLGGVTVNAKSVDFPGRFWLKQQGYEGINDIDYWEATLILLAMGVIYRLLAMAFVRYSFLKSNFVYPPARAVVDPTILTA